MSDNDNESEDKTIIPVEEEAMPALVDKSQAEDESIAEEESFLSRVGRAFINFLRAVLKLVLIVALVFAFGALVFYGLPYINRTFIAPVEENATRVSELENEIARLQTEVAEMNHRLIAVETTIETHSASIQKLDEIQATIENQLEENNNVVLLELKHEVMLARAFDMLGRARLYLSQSNFGLAKEDVQSARDILFELQTETNDAVLSQVVARLDLALGNLPQFPVVASGDLEIAWQILISGEATAIATSTPTPFVEPFLTATPTPFDVPPFTPTP
ncbi:MAG: hypothetical protein JNK81_07670 [Anaerolineales bacterium]|nr:hypothetical protein [Anaerolineales bacterium]